MKPKVYIRDFNGVLSGISKRTDEFEFVNDPRSSDVIVLWQDVRGELAELCRINKEYIHKPVVVVQHGVGATRDYQEPEKFSFMADKFCCWGTYDVDRLTKLGYGDKAVLTGSPLINKITPYEKHGDKNIIYCPVVAMHEEPANIITYYELKKIEIEKSQKVLIEHKEKLRDEWNAWVVNPENPTDGSIPYYAINKNWRLITKLTTIHDRGLYTGAVTISSQNSLTHIEDCVKLLSQTDVVVGMVEGTFQLLAMAMNIPVVICKGWEFKSYGGKDYSKSEMIVTDGVTYCDLGDLQQVIDKELVNPERLTENRKKVLLAEFGDITSDPESNIVKVIKELSNG